jgi:hypothetical protein
MNEPRRMRGQCFHAKVVFPVKKSVQQQPALPPNFRKDRVQHHRLHGERSPARLLQHDLDRFPSLKHPLDRSHKRIPLRIRIGRAQNLPHSLRRGPYLNRRLNRPSHSSSNRTCDLTHRPSSGRPVNVLPLVRMSADFNFVSHFNFGQVFANEERAGLFTPRACYCWLPVRILRARIGCLKTKNRLRAYFKHATYLKSRV